MTGDMFTSIDEFHGFPRMIGNTWLELKCLYGAHGPMFVDNEILTDEGLIVLPLDGSKPNYEEKPNESDQGTAHTERKVTSKEGSKEDGEKRYACEVCEKTFTKEINLTRHKAMAHKRKK
jgi:hypothetical protein